VSLLDGLIRASLALCLLIPLAWLLSAALRRLLTARLAYGAWMLIILALVPQPWVSPAAVVLPALQVGPELVPVWPGEALAEVHGPEHWWLLIWVLGLAAVLSRLVWIQRRVSKALGGSKLGPSAWPARGLGDWPSWLPVIESETARGPLLLGSLPPKLVLPATKRPLHPWVLAHEQAHLRHGDPFWNLLLALLLAVFWFHPLVHLAVRRIRRDQELAADEAVIAGLSFEDRRAYGQLLLNEAVNPAHGLSLSWKSTHPIKERIMKILQSGPGRPRRIMALVLLGLGMGAGLLLVAQADTGRAATQGEEQTAKLASADAPEQPRVVVRIAPRYPRQAYEEGIEGSVTLEANVLADGSVDAVRVVDSEPSGVFDQAAVQAFSQWRFDPTQNDRHEIGSGLSATSLSVRQTIEFKLTED
jgi:TonB family protein